MKKIYASLLAMTLLFSCLSDPVSISADTTTSAGTTSTEQTELTETTGDDSTEQAELTETTGDNSTEQSGATEAVADAEATGYTITFQEDIAAYTATYNGKTVKSCVLLVDMHEETVTPDSEDTEEGTEDSEDEEPQIIESFTVVNPTTYSKCENPRLVTFDKYGVGLKFEKTGIYNIAYNGQKTLYNISNGAIVTGSVHYAKNSSGILYQSNKYGQATIFTGVHSSYLYQEGALLKYKYVLLSPIKVNGASQSEICDPAKSADYSSGVIYHSDPYGKVTKYTGTGAISIYYNGKSGKYYVKSGKIQHYSGTAVHYLSISNCLYTVAGTGTLSSFTGVYKGYIYKSGKKKTTSKGFYVFYNGKIYLASKTGKLSLYKNTKAKSTYFRLAYTEKGTGYLVQANPKTGEATAYISDAENDGYYFKKVDSKLLKVAYATGQANLFTGVYHKKYYQSGAIKTASKDYYRVYNGYLYKINKKGAAAIYIKDSKKTTTYRTYVNGLYYRVYYNSGQVSKAYTSAETRAALLATATSYLGYNEKDGSHKKIIDIYNNHTPRARGYRVKYTDSWCATYVSAMFIKSGDTSVSALECSCQYQVNLWKKKGCWIENDAYWPKSGDIIYYHWSDSGKGDCTGWANHVGIVVGVTDGMITVIEGNRGGTVSYRQIPVNGRYIRGFASPKY